MSERDISQPERTKSGSHETLHFITHFVKHSSDLAIDSLVQNNAHARRADLLEARDFCAFAIEKNSAQ